MCVRRLDFPEPGLPRAAMYPPETVDKADSSWPTVCVIGSYNASSIGNSCLARKSNRLDHPRRASSSDRSSSTRSAGSATAAIRNRVRSCKSEVRTDSSIVSAATAGSCCPSLSSISCAKIRNSSDESPDAPSSNAIASDHRTPTAVP